jgi:hypothetical protein
MASPAVRTRRRGTYPLQCQCSTVCASFLGHGQCLRARWHPVSRGAQPIPFPAWQSFVITSSARLAITRETLKRLTQDITDDIHVYVASLSPVEAEQHLKTYHQACAQIEQVQPLLTLARSSIHLSAAAASRRDLSLVVGQDVALPTSALLVIAERLSHGHSTPLSVASLDPLARAAASAAR